VIIPGPDTASEAVDAVEAPGYCPAARTFVALALRAREAFTREAPAFKSIVVQSDPINPIGWLAANRFDRQYYWSDRDSSDERAGIGIADRVSRAGGGSVEEFNDAIRSRLLVAPSGTRYFGGLRFDLGGPVAPEWADFESYDFVLPRAEIRRDSDRTTFVVNLAPDDWLRPNDTIREIKRFAATEGPRHELSLPVFRDNCPDEDEWAQNVDWALDAFSRSRLAKVVLARRATFGFRDVLDPLALLERLSATTPNCYHFLFGHNEERAFVGASPERLFKLDNKRVWSEAVAGTRRRGATEGADAELCKELLRSEKDQREHVYVRQSIKEVLSGLCSELHVDASASEMRLSRGRHLVTRVEGVASEGVGAAELLIGLHPTPAVGGYPTEDAMVAISKLETFDRGWYAAPVGWIAAGAAEFAVAIRSGLVEGKKVSLYSGAGIVGGSTAEGEWSEIEDKIEDFISVFGTNGTTAT